MSNPLVSPQHTRNGRQFGAAADDSASPAAAATSRGRGRGMGAPRLRAASSGAQGRRGPSTAAVSQRAVDAQDQEATLADCETQLDEAAQLPATGVDATQPSLDGDALHDDDDAASQVLPAGAAEQASPAASSAASANSSLPEHLRTALAAVADKSAEVRAAVLEALLISEAAKPATLPETDASATSSGQSQSNSDGSSNRSDPRRSTPTQTISQLTKPVQDCVSKAVEESLSVRRSLVHAKRLEEGWTNIINQCETTHAEDGVWKFPSPSEEDDSVRIPKPLSNLMKGGGVGFKLTGAAKFLESERGAELQKLIDDDYRELAVKVLKHVRDFKTYECAELQRSLSGSEATLKAEVKDLFETTAVSAAVRQQRVAAALKQFKTDAAKRLEELENERRKKEIEKAAKKKELNKAELEARSVRSGTTFVDQVSAKAQEIVAVSRAKSEAVIVETLNAVQQGDDRPAVEIFKEKAAAADAAAKNSEAAESDNDKLARLRAEQQASAEALSNFEKEKAAKNGNSSRKSSSRGKGQNAKKKSKSKGKANKGGRK